MHQQIASERAMHFILQRKGASALKSASPELDLGFLFLFFGKAHMIMKMRSELCWDGAHLSECSNRSYI